MDNCGKARANTCTKALSLRKSAFIRTKPRGFGCFLLTQNNLADRMALCRRRVFQASTLSTWREHNRLPWWWRITEDQGSTPEKGPEKWPLRLRMAAGAQITHSRLEEVVTRNNETVLFEAGHRNGYNLNPLTSIKQRASLVPAAAVIPALQIHRIIAAVRKLIVGFVSIPWNPSGVSRCYRFIVMFGFESLTGFLTGIASLLWTNQSASNRRFRLNDRAWNNRKWFRFSFIGFTDWDNG